MGNSSSSGSPDPWDSPGPWASPDPWDSPEPSGSRDTPGSPDPSGPRDTPGSPDPSGPRDPSLPRARPGSRDNPLAFMDQHFKRIRSQCLRDGRLFEDPTFPAEDASVGRVDVSGFQWVRPSELFQNPQFFVNSFSTTDIVQGRLGDCWFLSAMSSLTLDAGLFAHVVPNDQNFQDLYAGIFHFRFWQYGRWVDVVIDDRLPTLNRNLIFTCSSSRNELWSALLEKAYAKIHGSYYSLQGGTGSEAMEDFSGGISVTMEISSTKAMDLWRTVRRALNRQTMISCSIQTNNVNDLEKDQGLGLFAAHSYAIVDAEKVRMPGSSVRLFRLRNPWGQKEYTGPWSDRSSTWKEVSKEEKTRLKLKISEDGEFWIPVNTIVENFTEVELCSVEPLCQDRNKCVWTITTHEGMWMSGISAGGNPNEATYSSNPQFRLTLLEEDEELQDGKSVCTISVQLLQKNGRKREGTKYLSIAFMIFIVPEQYVNQTSPFGRKFFRSQKWVFSSGNYINSRTVSRRLQLPKGHYVIVPSTYIKNQEREFFVRIFAKKNNVSRENGVTLNAFNPKINRAETDAPTMDQDVVELLREANKLSSTLSAAEFMEIFNSAAPKRFHLTLETCCSLAFVVNDPGERGWLTLQEAKQIMTQVQKLQDIFDHYAPTDSGLMDSSNLRRALSRVGFQLDSQLLLQLWLRHQVAPETITFSHFISFAAKLQKLFHIYEKLKSEKRESRTMDEWLLLLIGI